MLLQDVRKWMFQEEIFQRKQQELESEKNMKNKMVGSGKYRGRIDIFIIGWICVTRHEEEITWSE